MTSASIEEASILFLRESVWPYITEKVIPRFFEIVAVPGSKKDILWAILPLLLTLVLVQIYFGRNKQEDIGWNTAYGNCIVLLFVASNLLRHLVETQGTNSLIIGNTAFYKGLFIIALFVIALILMFIDFFHAISKKISFLLSSSIVITVLAYMAIVIVYADVPVDDVTLVTGALFLIVVGVFFKIFKWLIPPSRQAEATLERRKEKEEAKKAALKRKITQRMNAKKEEFVRGMEGIRYKLNNALKKIKSFFGKKE